MLNSHLEHSPLGFKPVSGSPTKRVGYPTHRKEMGLTRAQYSKLMGVTIDTVKFWEYGIRNPSKTHQMLIHMLIDGKPIPAYIRSKVASPEPRAKRRWTRSRIFKDEGT